MKMISSKAGTRLAKAKFALDEVKRLEQTPCEEMVWEYEAAANAVADELIADRHHLQEGD